MPNIVGKLKDAASIPTPAPGYKTLFFESGTANAYTKDASGNVGPLAASVLSGTVGPNELASGAVRSGHIASGQVGQNHLSVGGTPDGSKYLRDDFTWQPIAIALVSGDVQSGHVASGAIQGQLGATRHIASGTIGPFDLGSGAIRSGAIASGSVGLSHLASGAVSSGHVASGQITGEHLASGAVRSGHIGNAAVVSGSYASGSIASGHLASGLLNSITPTLTSGIIQSGHLASGTTQGFFGATRHIASGTVGGYDLGSGAIMAGQLGSGSVRSDNIASGSIASGHFASGFLDALVAASGDVVSGSVASGAVMGHYGPIRNIASGTVGAFDLGSGAVMAGQTGSGAITSGNIASGQIGWPHVASGTILSGFTTTYDGDVATLLVNTDVGTFLPTVTLTVASGAITSGKIASGQVGQFHVASGAITSGRLGVTGAPDGTKYLRDDFTWQPIAGISSGAVGSGTIASGAVDGFFGVSRRIQSGTVGVYDFGSGAVIAGAMGSGAVVSGNMASGQLSDYHMASGFKHYVSGIFIVGNTNESTQNVEGTNLTTHVALHDDGVLDVSLDLHKHNAGTVNSPVQAFSRSRGTHAALAVVASGDYLGRTAWLGYDGFSFKRGAELVAAVASGAVSSGHMATQVELRVAGGSGTPVTRIFVGPEGDVTLTLASGTVLSGMIASGQIGQNHLGSGAVLSGAIASGQVGFNHLSSGSVGSGAIASGQVTSFKLGSGAVVSGHVASGQLGTFHLTSGAQITYAKSVVETEVSGYTAWGTISGGRAVGINASGYAVHADPRSGLTMPAIGVASGNFTSGQTVPLYLFGKTHHPEFNFSGGLGGILWVMSGSRVGRVQPTASGNVQQRMGVAVSVSGMHLNPDLTTTTV